MAGIEAPHVAAHGDDAGLLGDLHQRLGVLDAVGDRDLDQHMLAGAHHLLALAEMHLGRRGEDHRVGALDAFGEFAGVMRDAVFLGDLAVESWLPPTSDVTSTSGMRLSASRCFWPNAPCPATQIFIRFLSKQFRCHASDQRHCERSEAIQSGNAKAGLLRRFAPRNDA